MSEPSRAAKVGALVISFSAIDVSLADFFFPDRNFMDSRASALADSDELSHNKFPVQNVSSSIFSDFAMSRLSLGDDRFLSQIRPQNDQWTSDKVSSTFEKLSSKQRMPPKETIPLLPKKNNNTLLWLIGGAAVTLLSLYLAFRNRLRPKKTLKPSEEQKKSPYCPPEIRGHSDE